MKIGVIGLGFMGSTHLKALKSIPGVEVAVVASDDERALSGDLSHIQGNIGGPGERIDFSGVRKYRDWQEAVADPGIEAVDICLPTKMHAPAAIAALNNGKHVLVEKPMALDGASAGAMMNAAQKAGRILMTAQVLRFVPEYRVMAEKVKSGSLGPVRSAIFRRRCSAPAWSIWMGNKEVSGGGVFDLLIHDVDFCQHLFGLPESLSATGHEDMPRGIDWITAQFHYPRIGAVVISGGWHHPKAFPFSMEYTVVADGGTVEFSSAGHPPALYRADGEKEPLEIPQKDGYHEEIVYFVGCVRDGRQPDFCPPEESANAVKLTRLMDEARSQKGEKIECKL
jgi:predicted dehydrogenase